MTHPQFPDESNYPLAQNQVEVIRPQSSVAINRMLGNLKEWADVDKKSRFGMILMNAFTIVRNVWFKGIKINDLIQKCNEELDSFTLYLEAYLHQVTEHGFILPLVIYYPHYAAIPVNIRRPPSPAYEEYSLLYETLLKRMSQHRPILAYRGHKTHRWILPTLLNKMPRDALRSWIREMIRIKEIGSYVVGDNITMMTGVPADLHLCEDFPNVNLWEYYTSIMKPSNQFGTKLNVPKEIQIPFSVFTHRVFGDTVNINGVVRGKQKTNLLQEISPNRWMYSSDKIKMDDLRKVNVYLTYLQLTSFCF